MSKETFPLIGEDIAGIIEGFYRLQGFPPEQASSRGRKFARLLLVSLAGTKVWFPADPFKASKIEARNVEIRAKFDGNNTAQLAAEFDLSRQWIWKIVNKAAGRVDDLFDIAPP